MTNSEIKKSEQLDIAFNAGRLAAVNGKTFKPSGFEYDADLHAAWLRGEEAQRKAMRAAADKIPLLFEDEKNGGCILCGQPYNHPSRLCGSCLRG